MIPGFKRYMDIWLAGQRNGYAGTGKWTKLPDGSEMVAYPQSDLLYVDRWCGSDVGGGQTVLYKLSEPWNPGLPEKISGIPLARMGYSWNIVRRFSKQEGRATG